MTASGFLGVWEAIYGGHGRELILIHQVCGKEWIYYGTKLTGDPNIPAGKVTFWFKANEIESGKFKGQGQIAATGYANPSWLPTTVEIKGEDRLDVTWVGLGDAVQFTRLKYEQASTLHA